MNPSKQPEGAFTLNWGIPPTTWAELIESARLAFVRFRLNELAITSQGASRREAMPFVVSWPTGDGARSSDEREHADLRTN